MLRYEYFLYVYRHPLQSAEWVAMETMKFQKTQRTFIFAFKWSYWTNLRP